MIYKGIIAVDFDGTIVDHTFPEIGQEKAGAIETLLQLQEKGWIIIIWTCREDEYIDSMKRWFAMKGFKPDQINKNIQTDLRFARHKIYADYYFDDRSFPPFPGWNEVRKEFLK